MTNIFNSYILPISGTDFVRYIAFYSLLAECEIKPQRIYCASGGCLVSYLAMMSSFTKQIEEWDIDANMLMERSTLFKLRGISFLTQGHFYRRPDLSEYVRKSFVQAKMYDAEIISGHYEGRGKKVVISTNFKQSDSSISSEEKERLKKWNVNIEYSPEEQDSVPDYTHSVIRKTSNIPFLLEHDINECLDFGVIAPTPRSLLNNDPNRSIYFSPINIREDKSQSLPGTMFYRMILNDIILLENSFTSKVNYDDLKQAIAFAQTKSRYCLLIYTSSDIIINITSFSKREVVKGIANSKAFAHYVVFYSQ